MLLVLLVFSLIETAMKPLPFLLAAILIVPFVEIYLLLMVGGIIGVLPTIFLVIFTAALGTWLLRTQGFATWQRFQAALRQGEIPAYEMIEGPILLVGGALLLTPGFFTDAIGFACLVPGLRRKIAQYVLERYLVPMSGNSTAGAQRVVIDGEYKKQD